MEGLTGGRGGASAAGAHGAPPGPAAHDLFPVTGAHHSARSYERLSEALERLQGTQIKTNIEAGGEGEEGFLFWLSEARLHHSKIRTGERRLKAAKVRLCD